MRRDVVVVAGTDTGVGKTVFAAGLTRALNGRYWKPVQAGEDANDPFGSTDTQRAQKLSGLPAERFLPEAYRLSAPISPHLAAHRDKMRIDARRLELPSPGLPLVVELAGGLLVPLTPELLQIEVVSRWRAPVALCARTTLGTINHTLLSVEALRSRDIPLLGVVFIGASQPQVEESIVALGRTRRLGRLPMIENIDAEGLTRSFEESFTREHFLSTAAA